MMQNYIYKYALILLVVGSGFASCGDKFLEILPEGQLSDKTFWLTEDDAVLALAGAYNGWENDVNILYNDAMSDNGYEQFVWGYRKKDRKSTRLNSSH